MPDDRKYVPWTSRELAALGTDTDRAVAAKLGRTVKAVETQRALRGIAPRTPHKRTWTKREIALLGTMSDQALADKLGVHYRTVYLARTRRGIAPRHPERRPI
jgi:hypothetical protein